MAKDRRLSFPPYPPARLNGIDASEIFQGVTLAQAGNDSSFIESHPSEQHTQRLVALPRFLVGISSKAYFSHAQTIDYVQKLLSFPKTDPNRLLLFFIPSFPGVSTTSILMLQRQAAFLATKSTEPLNLLLGAQECHFAPAGAHTGSVPASELAELGCTLVEIGHAERRRPPLNESDEMVAAKARQAVAAGLIPLVCIGERNRAEDPKQAMQEISVQIESVTSAVGEDAHIIFAYEPVWAIGQQEPAPAQYVCVVVDAIKHALIGRKGEVKVLYGGSAKPGIWEKLKGSADGLFLGRFGHEVEALSQVVKEVLAT